MPETTIANDINDWIEHRVAELITNENAHEKLPIHLQDPRFSDPINSLTGEIDVISTVLHRKFPTERPGGEFTFTMALKFYTCAIRSYDQIVAQAGGASRGQRMETLLALRSDYIAQQERFRDIHGRVPGDAVNGCEVQAVDTVLAELNQSATQ